MRASRISSRSIPALNTQPWLSALCNALQGLLQIIPSFHCHLLATRRVPTRANSRSGHRVPGRFGIGKQWHRITILAPIDGLGRHPEPQTSMSASRGYLIRD
ncbi:hypothetical protein SCLCIDRAFT_909087 [Scleroderma citrinum Foug A]|uniref:Uncharacterized protein n=1 Tax=Scleroderma citrinum Foug A TaxID=1036808 RepID=A0A0C3DYC1_9AGAM|nr:hypothetical protein SCLCIDRAFT_909087 [Scleroderma citrinum Foug A]